MEPNRIMRVLHLVYNYPHEPDKWLEEVRGVLGLLMRTTRVKENQKFLVSESIIISAFRHCLCTTPYMVQQFVEEISPFIDEFTDEARADIIGEIEFAVRNNAAGSRIDTELWQAFKKKLVGT